MSGRRQRIGVIELSTSVMSSRELPRAMPRDVEAVFAQVPFSGAATTEGLDELLRGTSLEEAALQLARKRAEAAIFACTTGSLLRGPGFDVVLAERLSSVAGITVTTTANALLVALKALQVRKLSVATPYVSALNEAERRFLEAAGYRVIVIEGLGVEIDDAIAQVEERRVAELARSVWRQGADAVFISCTNLTSFGVLLSLEQALGVPVFSSNAVTAWHVLGVTGRSPRAPQFGHLLSGKVRHPDCRSVRSG